MLDVEAIPLTICDACSVPSNGGSQLNSANIIIQSVVLRTATDETDSNKVEGVQQLVYSCTTVSIYPVLPRQQRQNEERERGWQPPVSPESSLASDSR